MIFTKSSFGRNLIETAKCSSLGNVGFFNRWTLEITNISNSKIPLLVGTPIAQIVFFPVNIISNKESYKPNYQLSDDLVKLKKNWNPTDMLPKTISLSKIVKDDDVDIFKIVL